MRRRTRMAIYIAFGLIGLLLLGAGGWIYMTNNVEQPEYTVIAADGAIEHRAYPALVAAEISTTGSRYDGVRSGFGPLASYIFAKQRAGPKIAMTAPVTQRARGDGDWTVQFIMPSAYRLEDLPKPVTGEVTLRTIPARQRAAIRFSGVADDAVIAEHETRLRAWLAEQGLIAEGAPIYAYYNAPFTPGFMRRNEVLFDIAPAP